MDEKLITDIACFIEGQIGITFDSSNMFQLKRRLEKLIEIHSFKDLSELYRQFNSDKARWGRIILEEATNNETYFFRDPAVFVALMENLKQLADRRHIKMWSAACSTGQEAFSMCMAAMESEVDFTILASDFCRRVLDKAQNAVFSDFDVGRGLRDHFLEKYFKQLGTDKWSLNQDVYKRIEFYQLNLLDDFKLGTKFDIVFLRNILIYMNVSNKQKILNKVAEHMDAGAILYLGAGESLVGLESAFETIKIAEATAYRRV